MEELNSGHAEEGVDLPTGSPARAPGRFGPAGPGGPVATLDLTGDFVAARPGPDTTTEPGPPIGLVRRPEPARPPRVKFATFVVGDADRLLGTAYLLTGDRARAEELLRAALATAGVTWHHHRRSEPEADVLRAMARQYTGPPWWWARPVGAVTLPGDVGTALDRLDSRHRVAIVLRYHQRLSEEETAATLGAPVGNVRTWISRALDTLGIDTRLDLRPEAGPGLSRSGLSHELAALAGPHENPGPRENPGPHEAASHEAALQLEDRLADVRSRLPALHRRERRRRAGLGTAIAAATAAVIAGALALAGPPPDPIQDADPALAHTARPPAPGPTSGWWADWSADSTGTSRAGLFDPTNQPDPHRFTFPASQAGDPLLASEVGDRGQDELVLRFTPRTTNLAFSDFCQTPDEAGPWTKATLNGHPLSSGPCRAEDRAGSTTMSRDGYPQVAGAGWADLGVRPGQASVLRVSLRTAKGQPLTDPDASARVRLGAAVYELTGPRVVSDGQIIKGQAEDGGILYTLGGYRTAKISTTRRNRHVPAAGPGPARDHRPRPPRRHRRHAPGLVRIVQRTGEVTPRRRARPDDGWLGILAPSALSGRLRSRRRVRWWRPVG